MSPEKLAEYRRLVNIGTCCWSIAVVEELLNEIERLQAICSLSYVTRKTPKEIISFGDLLGETILDIQDTRDELIFTLDNGEQYRLYHSQDCCEDVYIEDINGVLTDLIGAPLLMAEEVSHSQIMPDGVPEPEYKDESFTWTFYKMATVKGYVTIRWYGSSNGYYSESVDFQKVEQ